MTLVLNALRLMLGTLTILPVQPPSTITRRTAGLAMILAPLGGALLAVPVWGLGHLDQPLLAAALAISALAFGSRAIHLDGLADVADGLGSRAPAERALLIMKQSDIGPFGVVAVVLTVLVQVAALAQLFSDDREWAAVAPIVVSRAVLPCLCAWPAARADGLGSVMARSVSWPVAVAVVLLCGAVAPWTAYAPVGLIAGLGFGYYCVRRLGGTTGDVYGACVELTLTGSLLAVALA